MSGIIVVDTQSLLAVTKDTVFLTAIQWEADSVIEYIKVTDQNGRFIWSANSALQQQSVKIRFPREMESDGLVVPVLTNGTVYFYLR